MDFYLIETEDRDIANREIVGFYVDGFINKHLMIDSYCEKLEKEGGFVSQDGSRINLSKFTVEEVKYQWCKLKEDNNGEVYSILSDKEEAGSFGVTAVYW